MTDQDPTDPLPTSGGSTLMAIVWTAVFLAVMVLFVIYCWWRAHNGF